MIALGLTAANEIAGLGLGAEELLAAGVELEGHADNLAAALAGGVCLTWDTRIARLADDAPAVPIALVPEATVSTAAARAALPERWRTRTRPSPPGAPRCSARRSRPDRPSSSRRRSPTASTSPTGPNGAPLLAQVRDDTPAGALGATISGSGPSVIVWARPEAAAACARELADRFPDVGVLSLSVSPEGAHSL